MSQLRGTVFKSDLGWCSLAVMPDDTVSRVKFALPEIVSYGKLGASIGRPKAARAVGGVMANNLCPIVVPCHRVVGANGKLTGFSAGEGIALKRRMLAMEACVVSQR